MVLEYFSSSGRKVWKSDICSGVERRKVTSLPSMSLPSTCSVIDAPSFAVDIGTEITRRPVSSFHVSPLVAFDLLHNGLKHPLMTGFLERQQFLSQLVELLAERSRNGERLLHVFHLGLRLPGAASLTKISLKLRILR